MDKSPYLLFIPSHLTVSTYVDWTCGVHNMCATEMKPSNSHNSNSQQQKTLTTSPLFEEPTTPITSLSSSYYFFETEEPEPEFVSLILFFDHFGCHRNWLPFCLGHGWIERALEQTSPKHPQCQVEVKIGKVVLSEGESKYKSACVWKIISTWKMWLCYNR